MKEKCQNGNHKKTSKMTEEEKIEKNLYTRWHNSKEFNVLNEYIGKSIEEVPEEYREKIAKLREYGLGKTTYGEVIEWLEAHEGKMPRGAIKKNGKILKTNEMTEEEQFETRLYARWIISSEYKILREYTGVSIEEVPKEYREKITRLREFGLGLEKSKLQQAKQARDEAKAKNEKAKELEQQVSEELKKRGKNYGE